MTGWAEYGLAALLFVVAHAVPPRTTLRARLTGALGARSYLVLYSLLSLLLLYWLLVAAGRAPYVPLWDPAGWQAWIPNLVMPLALVLAVCGKLALDLLLQPSELYSLGAAGGH